MTSTGDPDDFSPEDARAANGYWSWLRDKPLGEREIAREILAAAGFSVDRLESRKRGDDPPDCEGLVDGRVSGIEVTELVHQKALERSLRGRRSYFQWSQAEFLREVRALIARKSKRQWLGGPYDLRALVIHTDEFTLDRACVSIFLEAQQFTLGPFAVVLLGLSYDPRIEACPTFKLLAQ